jgi:hypothetical protein
MRLFKKLKSLSPEEINSTLIGIGFIRAMDYETGKRGHLFLFSFKTRGENIIKKMFVIF